MAFYVILPTNSRKMMFFINERNTSNEYIPNCLFGCQTMIQYKKKKVESPT